MRYCAYNQVLITAQHLGIDPQTKEMSHIKSSAQQEAIGRPSSDKRRHRDYLLLAALYSVDGFTTPHTIV